MSLSFCMGPFFILYTSGSVRLVGLSFRTFFVRMGRRLHSQLCTLSLLLDVAAKARRPSPCTTRRRRHQRLPLGRCRWGAALAPIASLISRASCCSQPPTCTVRQGISGATLQPVHVSTDKSRLRRRRKCIYLNPGQSHDGATVLREHIKQPAAAVGVWLCCVRWHPPGFWPSGWLFSFPGHSSSL